MPDFSFRWGILSTARINRRIIPAIRASKLGVVQGISSRDVNRAKNFAELNDIPESYNSYQEIIDSDSIDIVYIPLPNHLHAVWCINAMKAGKHVLCEKPFTLTLEDCDRVFDTARETGCKIAEAFMYLHHPQTTWVKGLLQSGEIGAMKHVSSHFCFDLVRGENYRLYPECGGGALWDVGVYPVSFYQFLSDKTPEWVNGIQKIGKTGIDTTFDAHMQFTSGISGQFHVSFESGFSTDTIILGETGILKLTHPFVSAHNGQVFISNSRESAKQLSPPESPLYLGEVEDLHNAILKKTQPHITPEMTRNHIKTVLALKRSAEEKRIVYLDEME